MFSNSFFHLSLSSHILSQAAGRKQAAPSALCFRSPQLVSRCAFRPAARGSPRSAPLCNEDSPSPMCSNTALTSAWELTRSTCNVHIPTKSLFEAIWIFLFSHLTPLSPLSTSQFQSFSHIVGVCYSNALLCSIKICICFLGWP